MRYRSIMRFPNKAIPLIGGLLLAQAAMAVTVNLKENYQPIIDRNPFGLKPPPPPPTNNITIPQVEKPKIDIFLTGIVSVGYPKYPKKVFLKTIEKNKKDPTYYDLQEGVEKDGIKILNIDAVNKRVRIQTDSGETMLTFATHGVNPPDAAAMPMPGVPGQPGAVPPPLPGGVPRPTAFPHLQTGRPSPTSANVANSPNNFRSIPSRSIRSRLPGANYGGGTAPGLDTPGAAQVQDQVQEPPMDPAEQYLRMHLDKTRKEQQGIPMPPLPIIQ
jgi:hypothetical protein